MLVLTRKVNEDIIIGSDVRISIVEIAPGRVKIGISAPKSVRVDRAEIHEQRQEAQDGSLSKNQAHRVNGEDTPTIVETLTKPPSHVNRIVGLRRRIPQKPR